MEKVDNLYFHKTIAFYFASKPLYLDEPTQKKPNTRKLLEQPWQQTKAEMWNEVTDTLCNLFFIKEKCHSKLTYDLLEDFQRARDYIKNYNIKTDVIGSEKWNQWNDFIKNESENFLHFASIYPQIVFQQAYNTLYYPDISKSAKDIETHGLTPSEPWFKLYETEAFPLNYKPPLSLRKPISDIRKTMYQDLTSLAIINPKYVVSGYLDGWIAIWDIKSSVRVHYSKAHSWMIHCILPINDNMFATGGDEGIIKIWDVNQKKVIIELHGHTSKILCLVKWKDHFIISGSTDKTVRIWNLQKKENLISTLTGHKGNIGELFIIEEKYLISVSGDNTLGFWDIEKSSLIACSIEYTESASHSLLISSSLDIYSYGVSGVIYWGKFDDIIKKSVKERLFKLVKVIKPIKHFDTQGMQCRGATWLSDQEFLVLDYNKIFKLNIIDGQLTIILNCEDKNGDFHFGVLKINDNVMISWNKNGTIWKWNLTNLEREKIAILPIGEPKIGKVFDNETILIGTGISEEIYLIKIYPKKIDLQMSNIIINENFNSDEYPFFSCFEESLKKNEIEISDEEIRYFLKNKGYLFQPDNTLVLKNSHHDNWLSEGNPPSNDWSLDVRNFYIFFVKNGKQHAVLPGSFERCSITGTRFVATDIRGLKYWIELKNI